MHELDDITGAIIDEAIRIHRQLGPGLLESVMKLCLRGCWNSEVSVSKGRSRFDSNFKA
jgi:hypothetical protein